MSTPKSKKVKITTEGNMNGTWNIKISGIADADLYDTEVNVLKLFGQKKKKQKI
jgi:hypothetical protein